MNSLIEEIKEETKKKNEISEGIDTTYQYFWVSGKAVLTGKLIATHSFAKILERYQENELTVCPKKLKTEQQNNLQTNRKKSNQNRGRNKSSREQKNNT